ncbi:MAG: thioredoxin family protein [Dehalococcoidia bacterium]
MADGGDRASTLERYETGKSFQEYLDSGVRNLELFRDNYEHTRVTSEQERKLKELAAREDGPHHLMVIGEDWCPDVYRGAPVAARIAETMGIEYRFFERDQNKDLIAEYMNGDFASIPVLVFYDKNHHELGHFIERPRIANEEMHEIRNVMGDVSPQGIAARLGHEPSEAEVKQARAEAREKYVAWQKGPTWAGWRDATIDEVIELLS